MAAFLKAHADGVIIAVKLQPRASRDEIAEVLGTELKIKVTAPPVGSAANEALVRFLAARLQCSRGDIQLMRGKTSRHKQVFVRGLTIETAADKLKSPT